MLFGEKQLSPTTSKGRLRSSHKFISAKLGLVLVKQLVAVRLDLFESRLFRYCIELFRGTVVCVATINHLAI